MGKSIGESEGIREKESKLFFRSLIESIQSREDRCSPSSSSSLLNINSFCQRSFVIFRNFFDQQHRVNLSLCFDSSSRWHPREKITAVKQEVMTMPSFCRECRFQGWTNKRETTSKREREMCVFIEAEKIIDPSICVQNYSRAVLDLICKCIQKRDCWCSKDESLNDSMTGDILRRHRGKNQRRMENEDVPRPPMESLCQEEKRSSMFRTTWRHSTCSAWIGRSFLSTLAKTNIRWRTIV